MSRCTCSRIYLVDNHLLNLNFQKFNNFNWIVFHIIMGIPWDGTGMNCYVMGQTNMSHGQSCKKNYSMPTKCYTTRFLQEATQHQNRWPPRSCQKLSPCTKRFISVPASRAWRSAHIWEKQICLKIQQRQRNAKWFQTLLLPPSGSFNSKKF